jgi:hypothetical protein
MMDKGGLEREPATQKSVYAIICVTANRQMVSEKWSYWMLYPQTNQMSSREAGQSGHYHTRTRLKPFFLLLLTDMTKSSTSTKMEEFRGGK